jgi:hypothetical protein
LSLTRHQSLTLPWSPKLSMLPLSFSTSQ